MKTLLSILFAVLLFGCMSVQKATHYLEKKNKLAEVCASRYPVKDSLIIRERVTTDTVLGTSYIMVDTCNGKIIQKPCPPAKTITNTVVRDTTIYKRDMAYETFLQLKLDVSENRYNQLLRNYHELDSTNNQLAKKNIAIQKEANDWHWRAVFTWVLLGAAVAITIFWRAKK